MADSACKCLISALCPTHGIAAAVESLCNAAEDMERRHELAKDILPHVNGQRDSFPDADDVYTLCCLVLGVDPRQEHHIDEDGQVT